MTAFNNTLDLWMWPFRAAKLGVDAAETLISAQRVVAARLPDIADAVRNPTMADHAELGRMVSEKVQAFTASGQAATKAKNRMNRALASNAKAAQRLGSGNPWNPADWLSVFFAGLEISASLATLPAAVLAPVHRTVTANDRRLARKPRRTKRKSAGAG